MKTYLLLHLHMYVYVCVIYNFYTMMDNSYRKQIFLMTIDYRYVIIRLSSFDME